MAENTDSLLPKHQLQQQEDDEEEFTYFENCPGCKIDKLKKSNPGIPFKRLFFIFIVTLCAALPISSLFPFLYFMIRDFHVAEREEDIGYYAGYVGSSFMFGRALTAVFWGIVADKYGRKPVLMIGAIVVAVFNTLFGLSTNIWMAITTRFLLGSLCGILGPIKAYASEVCRLEHQALGMSLISTSWGIGLVIGPALGGYLAQPAEKYPNLFSQSSLFGRFPYLLPCLIISLFAVVVSVVCFWLPETIHVHKKNVGSCEQLGRVEKGEQQVVVSPKESILKNWSLMSAIIVYCVFSLVDMAYSEIFSLWAVSPRKFGGLNYTTDGVGEALTVSGLGLLLFQLFLYPLVERMIGPIKIARISAVLTIPLLSSYPYMALLSGIALTLTLDAASVLKNVFSTTIVTGLFLLQNRAVSADQRGSANGIALAAMSVFKAIGPAAGGSLFAWAQKRQDAYFLPGDKLIFFILNLIEFVGLVMTFKPFLTVPSEINP